MKSSREKYADINIGQKTDRVKSPVQGQLYMGKYLVNDEGYPYVPLKCLAPQNAGIFRPIDFENGKVVVRRALITPV